MNNKKGRSTPALEATGHVTLQQVAHIAGVSAATVSRILNGTAVVSSQKRKAVDAAIAESGFVPNPVARGLAGGRTLSIGVVTQSLDSPFYGGALRGVEIELSRAGYSPLFVSGQWHAAHEARCVDVLRSRRVDGIILLSARLSDAELTACARSLPVVVTGRHLSAPNLYALEFDNFEGARLATKHLLALGHKEIAFITGDMRHTDAKERLRGHRAALRAAGISAKASLELPGDFTEEGGRIALERLLTSGQAFSAVFASNDQMALGAALVLHRQGLRVPDDVSLVGFDDVSMASYASPPLSTVHHPVTELGQFAAAAMLSLLGGEIPTIKLPSPRFVVRDSTKAINVARV